MAIGPIILLFLACGALTFPLTLVALRWLAALSSSGGMARRLDETFEKALTVSIMIWIAGAFAFYAVALQLERRKPCDDQRTNQLTYECRKLYGQVD